MQRHSLFLGVVALLTATQITACRGRGHAPEVDPVKAVEIETVDISGAFQPERRLQYRLSGCGSGIEFQELDASDKLLFKIRDVKSGDQCKLEVIDEMRRSDKTVKWVAEPGTIYWTKSLMVIERGNRGQLRGVAMLSPGFVVEGPAPDYHKLTAPVTFTETDPADLDLNALTGALTCEPAQASAGVFVPKEGKTGEFRFLLFPPFSDKPVRCTRLTLSYEGKLRWRADIATPELFTPKAGGATQLVPDTLTLKPISEETASGIEVILNSASCKEGEVFDPTKGLDGECVPAK